MTPTPEEIKALVERLRERAKRMNGSLVGASDGSTYALGYYDQFAAADDRQAADALEAQAAQVAELRAEESAKWLVTSSTLSDRLGIVRSTEALHIVNGINAMQSKLEAAEKRLTEVEAKRDEARAYAFEATKAIISLTVGGSEFFADKLGDHYKADLPFCIEHIRGRDRRQHSMICEAVIERNRLRARCDQLVSALRAMLSNPDKHSRQQARDALSASGPDVVKETARRCVEIARNERVSGDTGDESDVSYNLAIEHVTEAIAREFSLEGGE